MQLSRLILAGLKYHWRIHAAVALGVAVTTAVLAGALLVGDSMRGSLQDLALERLGGIDTVVLANNLFRQELADEMLQTLQEAESANSLTVSPALFLDGAMQATAEQKRLAANIAILGIEDSFWQFDPITQDVPEIASGEVALSQSLAEELQTAEGDEVILRLPLAGQQIPSDTLLGERDDTMTSRRFRVAAILPPQGLARFTLRPTQHSPQNAFVPLADLQQMLESVGKINSILVGPPNSSSAEPVTASHVATALHPQLSDYGITLTERTTADRNASPYAELASQSLFLPAHFSQIAQRLFPNAQPISTYLANRIEANGKSIPYSTITGVDSTEVLGPLRDAKSQPLSLADDEIVLNSWAAKRLNAQPGDQVTLTYYHPDTTHGELAEAPSVTLTLRQVFPLLGDSGQPVAVTDRFFAPYLEGVTDQESINDWDLPFELVEPVQTEDEEYWEEYSTTPKAFVSLSLARQHWDSRYGVLTGMRIPLTEELSLTDVREQLLQKLSPSTMGFTVEPVKERAVNAATGTTPFEGLFIGFSFFLITAALILMALLFRLGIEGRIGEVGIMISTGLSRKTVRNVYLGEALVVTVVGALLGIALGIAYAATMIWGLKTLWLDAIVTPFLSLHTPSTTLLIGFAAGLIVGMITIAWSMRSLLRLPARRLLAGETQSATATKGSASKWPNVVSASLLLLALCLAGSATMLSGQAQAGAFFGCGALVLVALLVWLWGRWRHGRLTSRPLSLATLAGRNLVRHPSRSLLAAGLVASASFLIVAISAFRLAPTSEGTGGFQWLAESSLPVPYNLATMEGRLQLGFPDEFNDQLEPANIYTLLVHEGEDASCLNLYQTRQPRVLGMPDNFLARDVPEESQFAWADRGETPAGKTPWSLLTIAKDARPTDAPIPIILDANTAIYSLHLKGVGDSLTLTDDQGVERPAQVVALLANSVLQGTVLMHEQVARQLYPRSARPRFFLVDTSSMTPPPTDIQDQFETILTDFGFDVVASHDRLASFLVVQNTYLSTFQMLGALGLLLGTVGLAVVELRSVLERRGELAIMRAAGISHGRLANLILSENTILLLLGLGIGCLAALVAILPHLLLQNATIPWKTLSVMLLVIIVVGVAAGALAIRAVLKAPLLPALKAD